MEIIKRGISPADADHTGTCLSCGTVIKFKLSEGHVTYSQHDGNSVTIKCPVCYKNIVCNI